MLYGHGEATLPVQRRAYYGSSDGSSKCRVVSASESNPEEIEPRETGVNAGLSRLSTRIVDELAEVHSAGGGQEFSEKERANPVLVRRGFEARESYSALT
jgi:hypothetical protein